MLNKERFTLFGLCFPSAKILQSPVVANQSGDLTNFKSLSRDSWITLLCPGISCFTVISLRRPCLCNNCDYYDNS